LYIVAKDCYIFTLTYILLPVFISAVYTYLQSGMGIPTVNNTDSKPNPNTTYANRKSKMTKLASIQWSTQPGHLCKVTSTSSPQRHVAVLIANCP